MLINLHTKNFDTSRSPASRALVSSLLEQDWFNKVKWEPLCPLLTSTSYLNPPMEAMYNMKVRLGTTDIAPQNDTSHSPELE